MILALVLIGVGIALVAGVVALWGATLNARDRGELPPVVPWDSVGGGLGGCSGCSYLFLAAGLVSVGVVLANV